jgi:hypothetical protein
MGKGKAAMSWTDGYVTELGYVHQYYKELSPLVMELALTYRMQAVREARPLRYLELGFGQGLSLNIHAAAMNGAFWGNDFNPSHAAYARELARISGSGAVILDDSFAELAERPDLPEFDVIALHGIWSWVSDANRRVIVDIARRKLVPGGLLYMSYNAMPGWAAALPVRNLMLLHNELADKTAAGLPGRIDGAISFAQKLGELGGLYFNNQIPTKDWVKSLGGGARSYLAHEYFNADWHPMSFADVARYLEDAKLTFAASASYPDLYDPIHVTDAQQAFLADIAHPVLRETARDFLINRRFRWDVWVKGPRTLHPTRQTEALKSTRLVLTCPVADVPLKVNGTQFAANLSPQISQIALETLAADGFAPKSIGDIAANIPGIDFAQVMQTLILLAGTGRVAPVQSDSEAQTAKPKTDALNAHFLRGAVDGAQDGGPLYLASPVTGGGVPISGFDPYFLWSRKAGAKTPEEWAQEAWKLMLARRICVVEDGKALTTNEENLRVLTVHARTFAALRLPALQALMVA